MFYSEKQLHVHQMYNHARLSSLLAVSKGPVWVITWSIGTDGPLMMHVMDVVHPCLLIRRVGGLQRRVDEEVENPWGVGVLS